MFSDLGLWLPILYRRDGVLWVSTPYALGAGLLGLLGWQANVQLHWQIPGQVHAILGLFVAFLLFSNISQALQAYVHARQYLGAIRNGVRELARLTKTCVPYEENRDVDVLQRWFFLVGELVRRDLQHTGHDDLVSARLLTSDESTLLDKVGDGMRTFVVLSWISIKLNYLRIDKKIDGNNWFVMDGHISAVNTALGSCQRVQLAQLPADFPILGGLSIAAFIVTLPLLLAPEAGGLTWMAMIAVGYLLVGMLQLEQQTRDPFGNDPNDLDVAKLVRDVHKDVTAMFAATLPKPSQEETAA